MVAAGCAGLLFLYLGCGGAGTSARGGIDAETGAASGESEGTPARARAHKAKTVRPADIPLLSLDGVLPEKPPEEPGPDAAAGQQGPTSVQGAAAPTKPGSQVQGPPAPVPPALSQPGPKAPAASLPPPPDLSKAGRPLAPAARNPHSGSQTWAQPVPQRGPQVGPPMLPGPQATQPSAPQVPAVPVLPPRNLFGIEEDPAVAAERQRVVQEAAQKAAEAAQKAEHARTHWQGPPQPPPPPQPPAIPFQFIGYLGPPADRTGVFSQGSQLIMAKKNDSVMGQFKIVDIGYESAEIGFTGFKETQRIPLSGGGK